MKSAFMLVLRRWLLLACLHRTSLLSAAAFVKPLRAAAPGYIGRPKLRVVVRPSLRWGDPPG